MPCSVWISVLVPYLFVGLLVCFETIFFTVMQKQAHRMSVATIRLVKGGDPKDPSAVNDLGHWDSRDTNTEFAPLTSAMVATSQALEAVSKEWHTHVRKPSILFSFFLLFFFFFVSSWDSLFWFPAREMPQPLR